MFTPFDSHFFKIETIGLAKKLLGHILVHERQGVILAGKIVETEAYLGPEDEAAHSYKNLKTKRTAVMFEDPGRTYTYQMHTHTLFNVVSGPVGTPHAILIRAIEPIQGLSQMQANRGEHIDKINWTNGPGKLTKALGITMDDYGHFLTEKPLYIAKGIQTPANKVQTSSRIGIANRGKATDYPWRFYERGNRYVSKFRR